VGNTRALDIIKSETKGGMLDADLVDLFLAAKVWERGGAGS